MVLVRHDTTPVERWLLAEARGGVEEELRIDDGVAAIDTREVAVVVAARLALATDTEDELKGRVVEGEWDAADLLGLGLEVVLSLNNERFEVRRGELITLFLSQVDVRDLHLGLEIVGRDALASARVAHDDVRVGHDDELLDLGELDVDLHTMVGERGEGKGRARGEGEVERDRDVELALLARVADELRAGPATPS